MKNKGYYGWIHSLNEAGMQAHKKGIEMLAEQHARKGQMLNEEKAIRLAGPRAAILATALKSKETPKEFGVHVDDAYEGGVGAPIITDPVVARAVGGADEATYQELRATRRPDQIANPTPASIISGKHRSVRSEFGGEDKEGTIDTSKKPPYYAWAHDSKPTDVDGDGDADAEDVRLDVSNNVIGDEEEPEDEGKYELPSKDWKTVKESVSQKISRFLRN